MRFHTALTVGTTAIAILARSGLADTPAGFDPKVHQSLGVVFDKGTADVAVVSPGCLVSKNATLNPPSIKLPSYTRGKELLLLMVDLDTPFGAANHSFAPFLHWLQPGVKNDCRNSWSRPCLLNISSDTVTQAPVVPWLQPSPPPTSPVHRYVVLAYQQDCGDFKMPSGFEGYGPANRTTFDIEGFQKAADLGCPVAANWFEVAA